MGSLGINRTVATKPYEYPQGTSFYAENNSEMFPQRDFAVDNNSSPYTTMGCNFSNGDKKPSNSSIIDRQSVPPLKIYDGYGKLIKQNFGPYNVEYIYDENGIKKQEIQKNIQNTDEDVECVWELDDSGKATKVTWKIGQGLHINESSADVEETYDCETGAKIRKIKDNNGNILQTYTYDNQNRLISYYDAKKNHTKFEYNEQGLVTKETGKYYINQYKYNEQNMLIEMRMNIHEPINNEWFNVISKYEYNDKNQICNIRDFVKGKPDGSLEIKYDDHNKKTQRIYKYDDGTPYRVIKYVDGKVISDQEVNN